MSYVKKWLLFIGAALVFTISGSAWPCSSVAIDCEADGLVFVHNYGWFLTEGRIEINQRHVSKQALHFDSESAPAEWTSQYGSVTFNMYGRGMPILGMNENGLVVSVAWLDECVYPNPEDTPVVNELQLVQWLLDNFATVDEALEDIDSVVVEPVYASLHYMICDATDECAHLEYLDGELVIYRDETLPFKVMTNSTYADSLDFTANAPGPFTGDGSLARFARAAAFTDAASDCSDPVTMGFGLLDDLAQNGTVWRLVLIPTQKQVYLSTDMVAAVRSIDLTQLDFDCASPRLSLNIHESLEGAIEDKFIEYTLEDNRTLVTNTMEATLEEEHLEDLIDAAAVYPDSLTCTSEAANDGDSKTGDSETGDSDSETDDGGSSTCGHVPTSKGHLRLLPALLDIIF